MNINSIKLNFLLLSVLLASCDNQTSKDKSEITTTTPETQSSTQVQNKSARITDESLNAIYPHYLKLSEALVVEDISQARISANAIVSGTTGLKDANIISAASKRIAASENIDEQRTIFSELSNELIKQVKQAGVSAGEVYVEYCPMAFNDKGGYWLSDKKTIRNPYYGDEMLSCGSVEEVISD